MEHPHPLQQALSKKHFFDIVPKIPAFKKIIYFTKFQYAIHLLFYVCNKKKKRMNHLSETRKCALTVLKYKIIFHLKHMVLGYLHTFTITAGSV